jgi:hypothetical protein
VLRQQSNTGRDFLSCLFRTANIGLEDWMKVISFTCKTLHVPLLDYVQTLRLSGVNYQCIRYPDLEHNHQEDMNVAARIRIAFTPASNKVR